MNCPKCGTSLAESTKFCTSCGSEVQNPTPAQPAVQYYQPAPVQPIATPGYSGAVLPVKKKRHIARWVILFILLALIAVITWFVGSIMFFNPRDLGVRYTEADYQSALAKTGVQIEFNGMSGEELRAYQKSLNGKKLNLADYDFELSDYQRKTFTLTKEEATALLNELAPGFWWFEKVQVKANPDGTMEGSSTVDVKRIKQDLYSDVADRIPIPLPDRVNIYSKGQIGISGNQLSGDPQSFDVGAAGLPDQYLSDENAGTFADYAERVYTIIPGFEINSLTSDSQGNFVFDGQIPQSVKVTPKQ